MPTQTPIRPSQSFALSILACAVSLMSALQAVHQSSRSDHAWIMRTYVSQYVEPSSSSASSVAALHSAASSAISSQSSSLSHSSISSEQHSIAQVKPTITFSPPVSQVPHWGAMRTPTEWNRTYDEMDSSDFVAVPTYNLGILTTPLSDLLIERTPEDEQKITAKLYYSTRFFGTYDIDAGEFTGNHPGVDLKLAHGTPIQSIGQGVIHRVGSEASSLGLYVIVEHHIDDMYYYAIYGHMHRANVREGQSVQRGDILGTVGMTGETTGPHIHLQIDRVPTTNRYEGYVHQPYWPATIPSRSEALQHTVHPIQFINTH